MDRPCNVVLREVLESDLPIFFDQQLDDGANRMAAFTVKDPTDKEAFQARWTRMLANQSNSVRTILSDECVAGHVFSYDWSGRREVSYWLGAPYWGKGIATHALSQFLKLLTVRPVYARAAKDNVASLRVLQKCGFHICGEDQGFSNARGEDVEEFVLMLGDEGQNVEAVLS